MTKYTCPLCGKAVLQGEYVYGVCPTCARVLITREMEFAEQRRIWRLRDESSQNPTLLTRDDAL